MDKKDLRELTVPTKERLRQAILRGDKEEAISKLDELVANEEKYSDILTDWIDLLLTFVAEKLGEDAVPETMRRSWDHHFKEFMKATGARVGESDAEERMKGRARILAGVHGLNFSVEEDDEKFTIKSYCHTGRRIGMKEQFGKTSRPFPWSNSMAGMPYYCAHCTVCYQRLYTEQFGFPRAIYFPPKKPGDPCIQLYYKDNSKIPDSYFRMFGIEKER